MIYISDKIITTSDVVDYYDEVKLVVHLIDNAQHKKIRYIFNDNSDIVVEYTTTSDRIVSKSVGVSPARQPY